MDHESIESHLRWIFSIMNSTAWNTLTVDEKTHHLARYMSEIWRTHAFREGNTRTTIIFLSAFSKHKGVPLETSLFVKHTSYMRKALVASVFEDTVLEKERNYKYLETIIKDALTKGKN